VESGAGAVAGAAAGAGVTAGAGVAGVCAPAVKTIAMTVPAIVFIMRFIFRCIGTVPPKNEICCKSGNEISQKVGNPSRFARVAPLRDAVRCLLLTLVTHKTHKEEMRITKRINEDKICPKCICIWNFHIILSIWRPMRCIRVQLLRIGKSEEPVKIHSSFTAPKADPAKDFTPYGLWSWDLIGALARMFFGFFVECAIFFLNPDFMNVG
jgi:hypothetical protein